MSKVPLASQKARIRLNKIQTAPMAVTQKAQALTELQVSLKEADTGVPNQH